MQISGRNVVDIQRQDLESQVGVGQAAPARQRKCIYLRVGLRQIESAVGCQTFKQDFAKGTFGLVTAGAQIFHASSSLRMRTIGASTVDKACICARALFMRPSTV